MPSLYNPTPYPVGLRCCYWDAEYIASQPFCITSKLTEKELKELAEFEELKFWERNEQLKKSLSVQARYESDETLEEIKQISIEKIAVQELAKMREEKSLDSITSKLCKDFFTKTGKTSGRALPKNINKSDYLTR